MPKPKRPKAPQRPRLSAYFHFSEEIRTKMGDGATTDYNHQQLRGIIQKKWNNLEPHVKQVFQDRVDQGVERYQEEVEKYQQEMMIYKTQLKEWKMEQEKVVAAAVAAQLHPDYDTTKAGATGAAAGGDGSSSGGGGRRGMMGGMTRFSSSDPDVVARLQRNRDAQKKRRAKQAMEETEEQREVRLAKERDRVKRYRMDRARYEQAMAKEDFSNLPLAERTEDTTTAATPATEFTFDMEAEEIKAFDEDLVQVIGDLNEPCPWAGIGREQLRAKKPIASSAVGGEGGEGDDEEERENNEDDEEWTGEDFDEDEDDGYNDFTQEAFKAEPTVFEAVAEV